MPPDLALLSALIGSNYPCLELIFMVPNVFEPLKFDCIQSDSELIGGIKFIDEVIGEHTGSSHFITKNCLSNSL